MIFKYKVIRICIKESRKGSLWQEMWKMKKIIEK